MSSCFKSRRNIAFHFTIVFCLVVFSICLYNLYLDKLTVPSFFFFNLIAFILGYAFGFRFSCKIYLDKDVFIAKYFFRDEKTVRISTKAITGFNKHPDNVHRYFQKILIETARETFLIRYNIADYSDEQMLMLLAGIVQKNSLLRESAVNEKLNHKE